MQQRNLEIIDQTRGYRGLRRTNRLQKWHELITQFSDNHRLLWNCCGTSLNDSNKLIEMVASQRSWTHPLLSVETIAVSKKRQEIIVCDFIKIALWLGVTSMIRRGLFCWEKKGFYYQWAQNVQLSCPQQEITLAGCCM